jgi:glycosyltransferase 2 family protein
MIKTKAKQGIQFILFLSLGLFLLWYTTSALTDEDIKKVKELVFKADLLYVFPSIGALLLSHYIRSMRWKMMLDELGSKPGLTNVFLSVLVGYFLNLVFPRLGEVAKCSLLGKYEKMPVDKLIGTIVAERILDLICLVIVVALTIATQLDQLGSYAGELMDKLVGKANESVNMALFIITFFLILFFLGYWLFRKSKWLNSLQSFFQGIKEGLFVIRKIEKKRMFILHTVLIWFLYLLSIRIGFYSMMDTISLSWVPSLTILTFGSFAMIATQGGVGAYQLAVQKTLSFYQVNEVSGLAFGWLLWSVQTFMLLIVGPIAMFLLFFLNRRKV